MESTGVPQTLSLFPRIRTLRNFGTLPTREGCERRLARISSQAMVFVSALDIVAMKVDFEEFWRI